MKVFVCPNRDETGKLIAAFRVHPEIWNGLILDIGCGSRYLKTLFPNGKVRYFGLDLFPPADIIATLESRLPFRDLKFDTVVGLDVLEHADNIFNAFNEICRVARKYILITMPNGFDVRSRIKFLLGMGISGKYGLPMDPPKDRHRWIFSLKEARRFVHARAECNKFEVLIEGYLMGPCRSILGGRILVHLLPNVFSPWYLVLLQRKECWE